MIIKIPGFVKDAFKCDECGNEWIGEKESERCAQCRSRRWNHRGEVLIMEPRGTTPAETRSGQHYGGIVRTGYGALPDASLTTKDISDLATKLDAVSPGPAPSTGKTSALTYEPLD